MLKHILVAAVLFSMTAIPTLAKPRSKGHRRVAQAAASSGESQWGTMRVKFSSLTKVEYVADVKGDSSAHYDKFEGVIQSVELEGLSDEAVNPSQYSGLTARVGGELRGNCMELARSAMAGDKKYVIELIGAQPANISIYEAAVSGGERWASVWAGWPNHVPRGLDGRSVLISCAMVRD